MTEKVNVGPIVIGGNNIPVQTMIKNPVTEVEKTLEKIERLASLGCDIIRIAVPDQKSIPLLREVTAASLIPVVADIHFDHRLAVAAVEAGVHKVRINPGNIGEPDRVERVAACLKDHDIPVRIGINCGSLPRHLLETYEDRTTVMIEAAKEEISFFEKFNYHKIVLSFKSSTVSETIQVNRLASKLFPYPLHIGVTEAGDLIDGAVKNAAGLSVLLDEEIGNTIRVSLTAPEEDEIRVGLKILEAAGKRKPGVEIISCPTCGRAGGPIQDTVRTLKEILASRPVRCPVKIAVMGCMVNGPGEAKDADFGVAWGKERSIIFEKGIKSATVRNSEIITKMGKILEKYL